MSENTWIIDGLELDRRSFTLRRNGQAVRLDPKPLELLFLLVESQGAVISHNEALGRVWGEDVFVNGEAALYTAVKKIRQATGDPTLIETVPGKGYRLRAAAHGSGTGATGSVPSQQEEQRLAILPLANLSNDPEQDYFSDGLTEELINTISRFLRVRWVLSRGHRSCAIAQSASRCSKLRASSMCNIWSKVACGVTLAECGLQYS